MKVDFTKPILNLDDEPMLAANGLDEVAEAMLLAGIPPQNAQNFIIGMRQFVDPEKGKRTPLASRLVVSGALVEPDKGQKAGEWLDDTDLARRVRRAEGPVEITNKEGDRILAALERGERPNKLVYAFVSRMITAAKAEQATAESKAAAKAEAKGAKAAAK